jgi:hypothetical protein
VKCRSPYREGNVETHANELPGAVPEPENHAVDQINELRSKVAQLENAVDSHAVIDQAIGVIVAVGRLTPGQAWGKLAADIREELATRLNGST